jgi:hypothetical protein
MRRRGRRLERNWLRYPACLELALIKIPDRTLVVEVHDEAALLADQQDQLVAGHTPLAIEAAFFFLELLTAAQGALGQALLLDILILLEGIVHGKPPEKDASSIYYSTWLSPTFK